MRSFFKSLLFLVCCFSVQHVHAVPAFPHPIEYKQPDGSVITITLKGDERVNWAVSPDDYTLLLNKSGFYEYAVKNAAGDLVLSGLRVRNENARTEEEKAWLQRMSKNLRHSSRQVEEMKMPRRPSQQSILRAMEKPQMPFVGEKHIPVILVDFPGKPFQKSKADFEALFNQPGFSQGEATGSVRDYFLASSYEQLDLQFEVYGPYTLFQPIGNYDHFNGGNPSLMAYEAILAAFSNGCDLSAYDTDNDGNLDGVHIIFAGYDQARGATVGESIWSHAGYTNLNDLGGKQSTPYSCSPELPWYGGQLAPIGTPAHELGHSLFDLPDLYDTDNEGSGGYTNGIATWCIMSAGNWCNSGNTPAYHSAWCKDFLGWVKAIELTEPAAITLPNPAEQGAIYRINTKTPGEYFLLENRQQQGWDRFVQGSGMLIYHVDENYPGWYNNRINADPSHMGLYIKNHNPYPIAGAKFTDTSSPNSKSWAGENTEKPVTDIVQYKDGAISFQFMDDCTNGASDNITWNLCKGTLIVGGAGAIPDNVWANNTNIKTVIIEEGITSLGMSSFAGCTALTDIYISWTTPPNIQTNVFEGVEIQNVKLHIPKDVLHIYQQCPVWKDFQLTDVVVIASGFCGASGDNLTWQITDEHVLSISGSGKMMNFNNPFLVNLVAENHPWTPYYPIVKKFVVGDSVTSIGHCALMGLWVNEVILPNSLISIGNMGLIGIELTELVIPDSVISIGAAAFNSCRAMTSLTIPSSVTIMGENLLSPESLTDIYVSWMTPPDITHGVFNDEPSFGFLKENIRLHIPKNALSIYQNALEWQKFILVNDMPEAKEKTEEPKVIVVDSGTFGATGDNLAWQFTSDCILDITGSGSMGELSLTSVPWYLSCKMIKTVAIGNSVTSIGAFAFQDCSKLTSVTIPNLVTSIGMYAFQNCSKLTSVTIPNLVTSIGRAAFQDCSNLTSVTISNSVTSIEMWAFQNCSGLTDMYVSWTQPPIPSDLFTDYFVDAKGNRNRNIRLHIPQNTLSVYQKAPIWEEFILVDDMPPVTDLGKIQSPKISIYSNPVKDYLYIQSESQVEKIELYNQSGVCVLKNDTMTEKLDISGLADGFYLVRIYMDGIPMVKKIIVKK